MSKLLSKLSKVSRSLSDGESLLELELALGTGVSVNKKYFCLRNIYGNISPFASSVAEVEG